MEESNYNQLIGYTRSIQETTSRLLEDNPYYYRTQDEAFWQLLR